MNAYSWHIAGNVFCDSNKDGVFNDLDVPLAGVTVEVTNGVLSLTDITDEAGNYFVNLGAAIGNESADDWTVSIIGGISDDAQIVAPGGGTYLISLTPVGADPELLYVDGVDFAVDDPSCRTVEEGLCWMTGGGVKFDRIIGDYTAEHGPKDSLGGNVYPSCSEFPGNGGQWNHVAHSLKRHFMGTDIEVIRCGNVDGIEPGSESPVTPYNFIEFQGVGWVQGIHGNKIGRVAVTFQARVEDRNEPGNDSSATDGEDVDRYWLRVNGPPGVGFEVGTQDEPITITGGNLQLHATSCD